MPKFPEFIQFYSGYGSYHQNPINKTIHLICIPLILMSAIQLSQHFTFRTQIDSHELNFPYIFIAILSIVYIKIDVLSGFIASSFYVFLTIIGNKFFKLCEQNKLEDEHFRVMLTIHIICWILQFIGHGVFEKRAPALFDNLLQIFVAPDFVIIEILFWIGYKPSIRNQCEIQINSNIENFMKTKSKNM